MATTKKERICAITAILKENPNEIFPLSYFSELFGAAKSTLSEDISVIKETLPKMDLGEIEVILGANGGVKYIPTVSAEKKTEMKEFLAEKLRDPSRILPGGFIYTADIFLSPKYVKMFAEIIWGYYAKTAPDFIITVEAKGIPLAMEVARLFNVPLVVVRKENKLTEGSVVTINYISGFSRRMQTMSLSKRAVSEGQRTIIIDDFIAGGGTVKAVAELMKEFRITVLGCGVAITKKDPAKKKIDHYKSVIVLDEVDAENKTIHAYPWEEA